MYKKKDKIAKAVVIKKPREKKDTFKAPVIYCATAIEIC